MLVNQIEFLSAVSSTPCLTISFPTHRTHPDNAKDAIVLANAQKEATERLLATYTKREVEPILANLEEIVSSFDANFSLDSFHIFVSETVKEVYKSALPVSGVTVQMDETFHLGHLIKAMNRTTTYALAAISQTGVHVYKAVNDHLIEEIRNDFFPFGENQHYLTHSDKKSDGKQVDMLVREWLNQVDKALVQLFNETNLPIVLICTEDNYARLQQVADKPSIYLPAYAAMNYNQQEPHQLVAQAWTLVADWQSETRKAAIEDIHEAVSKGRVHTDLQEIYQAIQEGRGELLILDEAYSQAVEWTGETTFTFASDVSEVDVLDDISSLLALQVITKKGRVIYMNETELGDFGPIVLKTRWS